MLLLVLHILETVNPARIKCKSPVGIRDLRGGDMPSVPTVLDYPPAVGCCPPWKVSIHPEARPNGSVYTS
jgi:hypothetical protein